MTALKIKSIIQKLDMRAPVKIFFLLHAIAIFYPSIPSATQEERNILILYNKILSSYLTPSLVGVMIAIQMLRFPFISIEIIKKNRIVLYPALITSVGMILSMVFNDLWEYKTIFTGLNYLLVNIWFFIVVTDEYPNSWTPVIHWSLIPWIVLPLLVMGFPNFQKYVNFFPCTLHGFSDSRLIYGLWAGVLVILISADPLTLGRRDGIAVFIAMALAWLCMVLSQTRSSLVALLGSIIIALISSWPYLPSWRKLAAWCGCIVIGTGVGLFSWNQTCVNRTQIKGYEIFAGDLSSSSIRPGFFIMTDPTRTKILHKYIERIEDNWLWGCGRMCTVDIPETGASEIQAHNVFIQIWANYGVLTVFAFTIWLAAVYITLIDFKSKMLLVYFVVFSLLQPALGGSANIFVPQSMLVFMIIFMLNTKLIKKTRTPEAGYATQ